MCLIKSSTTISVFNQMKSWKKKLLWLPSTLQQETSNHWDYSVEKNLHPKSNSGSTLDEFSNCNGYVLFSTAQMKCSEYTTTLNHTSDWLLRQKNSDKGFRVFRAPPNFAETKLEYLNQNINLWGPNIIHAISLINCTDVGRLSRLIYLKKDPAKEATSSNIRYTQ